MSRLKSLKEGSVISVNAVVKKVGNKVSIHLMGYEDKIIMIPKSRKDISKIKHIEMVVESNDKNGTV